MCFELAGGSRLAFWENCCMEEHLEGNFLGLTIFFNDALFFTF